MLYVTYSLDILLLFALPIALGIFLVRKFYLEGRWWWIGAIVYIISQIILVPLENYSVNPFLKNLSSSGQLPSIEVLIFGGLLLGLCAGLIEELLRYAMFRWWTRDARGFESGLLLGTGFGGAASIFLALLVIYNFVNMIMVRNQDLTNLASATQLPILQSQITAFWSAPWYSTFREAIGQLFMLSIEICLTVMVLQVFTRKQWYWVLIAIGFHTVVEAARIITLNLSDEDLMYAVQGVFAIIGLLIILALQRQKVLDQIPSEVIGQTPSQANEK